MRRAAPRRHGPGHSVFSPPLRRPTAGPDIVARQKEPKVQTDVNSLAREPTSTSWPCLAGNARWSIRLGAGCQPIRRSSSQRGTSTGVSRGDKRSITGHRGIIQMRTFVERRHHAYQTDLHRTTFRNGSCCGSDPRRPTSRGRYRAVLLRGWTGNHLPDTRQCTGQRRPSARQLLPLRRRSIPPLRRLLSRWLVGDDNISGPTRG
jgi:hypothetical protein